jgi:hypothetical protein
MTFEIYYDDLTEEAQKRLCEAFQTSPEEENWDVMPLTLIEREEEGE